MLQRYGLNGGADAGGAIGMDVDGFAETAPLISEVRPSSPADAAGLHAGDFVLQIDRQQVGEGADAALRFIAMLNAGSRHVVQVQRGDKTLDLSLTVTPSPQGQPPTPPAAPAAPAAGCAKDTDCKGDRVCVQGQCGDPAQAQ